jgi:hypothetical protein
MQRTKTAWIYSITSSARPSSIGGTSRPECLGGLEVDYQLVLGRCLHRQVGRLLALENAIDISCRAAELIDIIGAIGHQTAAGDVKAGVVHGRAVGTAPPAQ